MSKIYLPVEVESTNCAYMYDKDTIRVYEEVPRNNATIAYTDYFINSDYLSRSGYTTFGNYNTFSNTCLSYTNFTTNAMYRLDLAQILIIAFIFTFIFYYMIRTLVRRLFYGRRIK